MTRNPMLLFGSVLFAILAIGLIVVTAIDSGVLGWLIFGTVVLCVVFSWLISFAIRQYVQWTEAHVKAREVDNNFMLAMAKIGYLPNSNKFKAVKQLPEPIREQKPAPQIDPRHDLLIALCMATIRTDGYGPQSERLLTADDAQARGGRFADRNNWAAASEYGQSIGELHAQIGGKPQEQGLRVRRKVTSEARTVTDLLETLHDRNVITDSAVSALPGMVR